MQLQKSFNFQLFKSRSEMLYLQWFLQQCLQQCVNPNNTFAIERKRDELFIRKLIKLFYWNCKNLTTWTVNLNRLFERSMGRVDIQMSRTNESDRWVGQMSRTDESNRWIGRERTGRPNHCERSPRENRTTKFVEQTTYYNREGLLIANLLVKLRVEASGWTFYWSVLLKLLAGSFYLNHPVEIWTSFQWKLEPLCRKVLIEKI